MVVLTRQVALNLGVEQLPAPLLTGQNLPLIIVTVIAKQKATHNSYKKTSAMDKLWVRIGILWIYSQDPKFTSVSVSRELHESRMEIIVQIFAVFLRWSANKIIDHRSGIRSTRTTI